MTGWLGVLESGARDPKQEPYIRVRMLLDDGNITLRVRATDGQDIVCDVERGGVLSRGRFGLAAIAGAVDQKHRLIVHAVNRRQDADESHA